MPVLGQAPRRAGQQRSLPGWWDEAMAPGATGARAGGEESQGGVVQRLQAEDQWAREMQSKQGLKDGWEEDADARRFFPSKLNASFGTRSKNHALPQRILRGQEVERINNLSIFLRSSQWVEIFRVSSAIFIGFGGFSSTISEL